MLQAKNRNSKKEILNLRKPWIAKILKRWLFVAKKVPYKFPNDTPLQLLTLHFINSRKTKTWKKKFLIYEKTMNHKNS